MASTASLAYFLWLCCYFLGFLVVILVVVPVAFLTNERFAVTKLAKLTEGAKKLGRGGKKALCDYMRAQAEDRRLQVFGCAAIIESADSASEAEDWTQSGAPRQAHANPLIGYSC